MSTVTFDAVVKIGGSLDGPRLPEVCRTLATLATRHRLLVIPGGGRFADAVRDAARRYPLSDSAAHWMAILGMDQYGYLLQGLIPASAAVCTLPGAAVAARGGTVPVLLPFAVLHRADPLPHSWDVTSDSIAAWLCGRVRAVRLILLKDVAGIHAQDPRTGTPGAVLPLVHVAAGVPVGGIDPYLGHLLPGLAAEVWVIGGTRPGVLAALLEGPAAQVVGTRLVAAGARPAGGPLYW